MLVKYLGTVQSGRIRPDMDKEKHTQRNDARELMQLSQKKGVREFYRHPIEDKLRVLMIAEILVGKPQFSNEKPDVFILLLFSYKIK